MSPVAGGAQLRRLATDARAYGVVVLTGTTLLGVGVVLWPADARIAAIRADGRNVRLATSTGGGPIFTIANLRPGQEGFGEVTITNDGALPFDLTVEAASVADTPGPAGGRLSQVLLLALEDVTGAARAIGTQGLTRGSTFALGSVGAGESRRYRFRVIFPQGGAPPTAVTGDNAFMGASTRVDFLWRADGQEVAEPRTPQTAPSTAAPTIDVRLAPATSALSRRPVRVCASRRLFTIRIRESRRQRLRSARVWVDGRRVTVRRRAGRLTARIDLRGRPRKTARVRIVAVTTRGRRLSGIRIYRPCRTKLPGGVPRL